MIILEMAMKTIMVYLVIGAIVSAVSTGVILGLGKYLESLKDSEEYLDGETRIFINMYKERLVGGILVLTMMWPVALAQVVGTVRNK